MKRQAGALTDVHRPVHMPARDLNKAGFTEGSWMFRDNLEKCECTEHTVGEGSLLIMSRESSKDLLYFCLEISLKLAITHLNDLNLTKASIS